MEDKQRQGQLQALPAVPILLKRQAGVNMYSAIMTYPVKVQLNGKTKCIEHVETDELMRPGACYIFITHDDYSGYDIYLDYNTRKYYASDCI